MSLFPDKVFLRTAQVVGGGSLSVETVVFAATGDIIPDPLTGGEVGALYIPLTYLDTNVTIKAKVLAACLATYGVTNIVWL